MRVIQAILQNAARRQRACRGYIGVLPVGPLTASRHGISLNLAPYQVVPAAPLT